MYDLLYSNSENIITSGLVRNLQESVQAGRLSFTLIYIHTNLLRLYIMYVTHIQLELLTKDLFEVSTNSTKGECTAYTKGYCGRAPSDRSQTRLVP